jgi:hypothetical protein
MKRQSTATPPTALPAMEPTFLELEWGDGELDAGKEDDDAVAKPLLPVNLGIPLSAAVWPCDVSIIVHQYINDGTHEYEK